MRDIHVVEIINRMLDNINYSKVICRHHVLKERLK